MSERQKTLDDIANRIKTNPIGWLPTVGDVINVTFDIKNANLVANALKRDHLFEEMVAALEKALAVIADCVDYEHNGDPWTENAFDMGELDIHEYAKNGELENARAILAKLREAGQ